MAATARLFLLLLAVFGAVFCKDKEDESCRTYAGGQVYPQEVKTGLDHALHWSKALNKKGSFVKPGGDQSAPSNLSNVADIHQAIQTFSQPAPHWEGKAVVDGEFKDLKLSDFKGKYLVFFFYPMDFTFVCPTEIIAFSDRIEEFKKMNTEVVACSVDSVFTHLAWINTPRKQGGLGKMRIPILADLTKQISKDYGVLLENEGHTLRGLFIIDDKGILRQITMNDLPVGRSVDETLRLVQAFQYTDKHGEVCPAGWKPGADTIVPDPKEKLNYFTKQKEEM